MAQSNLYKFGSQTAQTVDVTSDGSRDVGNVDVTSFGTAIDVTDRGGRQLGEVYVANTPNTDVGAALASTADADTLEVSSPAALDTDIAPALSSGDTTTMEVSAPASLDVASPAPLDVSAATVPVEQQTPTGVEDSTGTQVDPATEQTASSVDGSLSNEPNVGAASHTTVGTDAEPLPANAVPDGKAVAVQAKRDNSSNVFVGNSATQAVSLAPGNSASLQVQDTSSIYIQTPTAGDGVNLLFESA